MPGGSLWTGVRQWISSVLGTEKSIFLAWAIARMVPKAAWRERALVRYEEEELVRAKSSTYERTKPWGREICKGETYITNNRGEIGEPCGVPTETGEKTLGEPWKRRRQDRPERKDLIQATR